MKLESEDEFAFDESQLDDEPLKNEVKSENEEIIKINHKTVQFQPQNYQINDELVIQRPFSNAFATFTSACAIGFYTIQHPNYPSLDIGLQTLWLDEQLEPVKTFDLTVGQAVLWKCGKSVFRRARIEQIHKQKSTNLIFVDITLIDVGRKIYYMKTDTLLKVGSDWLISDKCANVNNITSRTRYSDLPARAIMMDHESEESLPVDFNTENDTKYKVKVTGKQILNGWPIYSLELIEKNVNNQILPTLTKTEILPNKSIDEQKEQAKHEKAVEKLMHAVLINLGDSVATPECTMFLEWELSARFGNSIILRERVKPEVVLGYKPLANFKISLELFVQILDIEDDIKEYILEKKPSENWDSIRLGEKTTDFKKVFINFDEQGQPRIVFREFYWSVINQEIMKGGLNKRIVLSENQFGMFLEAKNDILNKFKEANLV